MNHLSDEQLNEFLDGESAQRAAIDAHLAQCEECAARLDSLRSLFAEIESLPEMQLTRDFAASFAPALSGTRALPRWVRLTLVAQGASAAVALMIAGPFVLRLAQSSSIGKLELPSVAAPIIAAQAQWTSWLDTLSQTQLPSMPALPGALGASSLYLISAAAGVSICWLVGNGLLLRRAFVSNGTA